MQTVGKMVIAATKVIAMNIINFFSTNELQNKIENVSCRAKRNGLSRSPLTTSQYKKQQQNQNIFVCKCVTMYSCT